MNYIAISIETVFWISVLLILHSYLLFPITLKIFSHKKTYGKLCFQPNELPFISILIAARNEQDVIEDKLNSVLNCNYPHNKFEILVGSDASDDDTNKIVASFAKSNTNIKLEILPQRSGKGNVINHLFTLAKGEILVFTDANIMFTTDTLFELIKPFKDKQIGLVDANMLSKQTKKDGVSIQEDAYISREVSIKYLEGRIWGCMMGPFGGCFAVRKKDYTPVPANFLVDDFFINMSVLAKGQKAINSLGAKVFEDTGNNMREEFRRKVRISTGNFQNLARFKFLIFSKYKGVGFSFFSHKIVRWVTPILILTSLLSNLYLWDKHLAYNITLISQLFLLTIPFLELLLRKIKIHIIILRFVSHFYVMNTALMVGFFKYIKGVQSNVWEPTKRNQ